MVFMNHHYLDNYVSFVKTGMTDMIKPYLDQEWYKGMKNERGEVMSKADGARGMARPRNEKIIWMKSPGGEKEFTLRGLEVGDSGGEAVGDSGGEAKGGSGGGEEGE